MNKSKIFNLKNLHLAIIIVGIIFVFIPVFHSNLWFDESYSVALANHSYKEIWTIGGNDVHPILYYWILHTLQLVFGNRIIIYRLFSAACIAVLGIIGFTHIRKDFGEETGLLFSFLSYFLPVSSFYASEIRMYSLGLLLGTIMSIYAYRIYKNNINKATFFIFTISSLSLAYTHYYGLMLAGIVNLLLFIHLIKNNKNRMKDLKKFIICAIIQVLLYIPWIICFLAQIKHVSSGFWITVSFPETFYEILTLHFKGNLTQNEGLLLAGIVCTYLATILLETKKNERTPVTACLLIYLAIIIIACIVSLFMHTVILLCRYLVIISGLIIFTIAFLVQKDENKYRKTIVFSIILLISVISNISLIIENYNLSNLDCINYINNNIQSGEIIIYSDVIDGAVITTEMADKKDNVSYFYNKNNWSVHEAYKAFSPYMEIKENLNDIIGNYHGRIWVIESANTSELAEEISNNYDIKKVDKRQFKQNYKKIEYTVEVMEKE